SSYGSTAFFGAARRPSCSSPTVISIQHLLDLGNASADAVPLDFESPAPRAKVILEHFWLMPRRPPCTQTVRCVGRQGCVQPEFQPGTQIARFSSCSPPASRRGLGKLSNSVALLQAGGDQEGFCRLRTILL